MLILGLLVILCVVVALSYYENREYFDNLTSSKIGDRSGPNLSYGTLNTTDSQIGSGTGQIINPLTNKIYNNTDCNNNTTDSTLNPTPDPTPDPTTNQIMNPIMDPTPDAQIKNDVNPQVSVSDTGYNAMELQNQSLLLSNIKKIVQDELRTSRVQPENHPVALNSADGSGSCSNSAQQGNEYINGKKDMSKYIKKDSIP